MNKYNHQKIEKKWQAYWDKKQIYFTKSQSKKTKKYVLVEFPYPSGEGLHMGHLRPYVAGDVYSRFQRMKGFETMFPMGWDAFGLPAENFALKKGVHPSLSTKKNIQNAKRQIKSWGVGFDWSREINTTDPGYYKWTQWIFLQLYKAGLAFEGTGPINWCPSCKTGLANEEVGNGQCERCGTIVEKKEMRQWYLKITAYAEKLIAGLKDLDWPFPVKIQQENWIGKSEGAEIEFPLNVKYNYVLLHGFKGNPKNGIFFPWLTRQLEKIGARVSAPQLPHPFEPKEEEQVDYVLNNIKFDEQTILLGHSLGSVVALKVLERLKGPIAGLVLVGGFVEPNFKDKPRPFEQNFKWSFNFQKIKNNLNFVKILSDTKDSAVPMEQGRKLHKFLGGELIETIAKESHFSATSEPEILDHLVPKIKVFTTRPDTLFGATYMVISPEHPMINMLRSHIKNFGAVREYIKKSQNKSDMERTRTDREKTGVKLIGVKAINPASKEQIPVFIADYVLIGYGTGGIMAVPAHDQRDWEFAKKFHLPIKSVIQVSNGHDQDTADVWTGPGVLYNSSDKFDKMDSEKAKWEITKFAGGVKKIHYKLRDWVFSRQRYWGEPIPIIHCDRCGTVPIPEKDLPVTLPKVAKYEPTGTGESPLAVIEKWVNVKCPDCKARARRETNTMPQWAGSSWYYLRYIDPKNKKLFANQKILTRWLPVDVYFGGMEHTTLHLLYSRFWHQALYDLGYVPSPEPYTKRVPHGIVLGPDGEKMSKSRGNVVNPDGIVLDFGADTLRMCQMFLGPHEAMVAWNNQGALGVKRFLDRVWYFFHHTKLPSKTNNEFDEVLHRTIKKLTKDIETFSFNTAVSSLMVLLNSFMDKPELVNKNQASVFLRLLAPFAPHLAEELWQEVLANKKSIHLSSWPEFDQALLVENHVTVAIQISGKLRATVRMTSILSQAEAEVLAKQDPHVQKYLKDVEIKKVIYIPGKIINFVIS